jgi:hypothetical protein
MHPPGLVIQTALLCLVLALVSPAQIGTATISGQVADSTGAAVPSAKITVVNTGTNFRFSTETNPEGLFRVQSLQPGTYRLTIEAAGFKTLARENIILRTGDTAPADVTLEVGTLTESIEVSSSVPLLETETSATGTVVAGKTVYELPLYQRYVNDTLHLVPGMEEQGYASGGSLGAFHVAGQRSGAIGFFEDGVNGNDQLGGTGTVKPIQNAVEDVKVLTTALPAEYGHSAGGVISVVKKTGTNEFHGLVSNYGRSRIMVHRNFFDSYTVAQPRPGAPNGFPTFFLFPDANVGGPVVIPRIYNGRNKTFFYFGYQKLIDKQVKQFLGTVPTTAMKAGDFSFGGIGSPIYDPSSTRQNPDGTWSRDPFPNTQVPLGRIDPVARQMMQINPWQDPNLTAAPNASGPVSNLLYNRAGTAFFQDFSGRLDHQVNEHLKLYGSYTYNHTSGNPRLLNMRLVDFEASAGNRSPFTGQDYSAGGTWIASPTLVNDARIGYYRRRNDTFVPSWQKNYAGILGIPNVSGAMLPAFGPQDPTQGDTQTFTANSLYGLSATGPSRLIAETISFRDDLTKMYGKHAFKVGYELMRFRVNSTATNQPSGMFQFDTMTAGLQPNGTTLPRTGNTFAGFLTGAVRQATFDQELTTWLPRSAIQSFYVQDDWRITPKLTLNLGVRYSNETPFTTKYGQMSNFDPSAVDPVSGMLGAVVHPTSPLNKRDNNNFQPRFGMAWHPLERWVFRGGFAVNTVDVKFPSTRGQFEEYVSQTVYARAPGDPRPIYQISAATPVSFNVRSNGTSGYVGTNYSSRTEAWWDSNLRNPYVLNWNVSTQYSLKPTLLIEGTYQGSAGNGLLETWQANTFPIDYAANNPTLRAAVFAAPQNYRPFTQFGNILFRSNFGHSTYHSGTIKLEKRYSRGLTFLTFYTFSKAIDSQDTDNSGTGVAPIQNRSLEKARAGFDRNHRVMGTLTYELPVGKGKRFLNRGGVMNWLFGGYEIAWIQTLESGNPLTFSFANSPNNYYPAFAGSLRPNLTCTPSIRDGWRDLGGDRFNQNNINAVMSMGCFAYPVAFTPGNAGRNIVTGLPLVWSQVSAKKNFRFHDRYNLQVRWDMQNAFKTYNFDPPTTTVDFLNPLTFGKVSSNPTTASWGGQPLMNLTLQFTW